MDTESDPKDKDSARAFIWLMVGLAPILIFLVAFSASHPLRAVNPLLIFGLCALCNLLGGLGCVRNLKDGGTRTFLGLFLAGCFFVLSWIVAVFQACSQSNGI